MSAEDEIRRKLEAFRESYATLFGEMPPLPERKFSFSGDVDPAFLDAAETLRAKAFYNSTFDIKQTQLLLFGMLVASESPAAKHHANAARRAGATWQELHAVVALACAVRSLGPLNQGSALLSELRENEAR